MNNNYSNAINKAKAGRVVLWLMCQARRQDIFILFLMMPDSIRDLGDIVKPNLQKMHPLLQFFMLCSHFGSGKKRNKTPYTEFIITETV